MRVGVLLLRAAELFHALGGLLFSYLARVASPSSSLDGSSHSCAKPLIVTALKHRTSDTRLMCSLIRVMSEFSCQAVLLVARSVSRGTGVFWLILSIQSRAMGSVWILRRFAMRPLGLSSAGAVAWVAGAVGAAQGVLVWAISSCVRGSGWSLLVATSPAAATGLHAGAHGPVEHVPRAAASWSVQRTVTV